VTLHLGDRTVLKDVNIVLEYKECLAIVGPNGAGKTHLLLLIHGVIAPSSGSITWDSKPQPPEGIVLVEQRPTILRRSVLGNIEHALSNKIRSPSKRRARAWEALQKFGLQDLARQNARSLSGGEQRLLALARGWALAPKLLLLDEPWANLAPTPRATLEQTIMHWSRDDTMAIIFVTHDHAMATRLAERIYRLDRHE
ncbi:MAG: ATP-binding cassette domain-containing protein, partial [Pseudomonadota bacterium]